MPIPPAASYMSDHTSADHYNRIYTRYRELPALWGLIIKILAGHRNQKIHL